MQNNLSSLIQLYLKNEVIIKLKQMINEITCNNNNAIQMSRGQLLQWVNNTMKLNYTKIQQMGSGAAYCKMLDLMYPGAVPMGKVNWKAKFDYQYVNNFKVLQQSFTKLNILKHIDVQKLVKCKYQDNLEFLQWFKKIFDNSNVQVKEVDSAAIPVASRKIEKQKENKAPVSSASNTSMINLSMESLSKSNTFQKQENAQNSFINKLKNEEGENQNQDQHEKQILKRFKQPIKFQKLDENLLAVLKSSQNQQKQFYLRKLKEIQNLVDNWSGQKSCGDLINEVRGIILAIPENQWDEQYEETIDTN